MRSIARCAADFEIFLVAPAILVLAFPASMPSAIAWLALAWIAFLWLCRFIAHGRVSVSTPVDLPIVLLLILLPLNLYASADLSLSQRVVFRIAGEVAALYAVVNWADCGATNGAARVRLLSVALIVVGAGVALLGLLATNLPSSKVLNLDVLTTLLPHLVVPPLNPLGISSNLSGGFAAVVLPLALAQLLWAKDGMTRLVSLVGALVLGGTVFVSQSRGAWIGVALALIVMALLTDRRFWFLLPLFVIALAAGMNIFGIEGLLDFVASGTTLDSAAGRMEVWQRAVYMLQDFPFTGVGIGTFGKVANILYPFFLIGPDTEVAHAHNIYLQAGVDQGIPGMVAMIGLLTALGVTGLDAVHRAHSTLWRGLVIGLFGGLVVFLAHGMFDMIAYTLKTSALIYASFGLMIAVARCLPRAAVLEQRVRRMPPIRASNGASEQPHRFGGRTPWVKSLMACVKMNGEGIQAVFLWVLVSLLAIAVMGDDPLLGLALVALGGIAVGLQGVLWFARGQAGWNGN